MSPHSIYQIAIILFLLSLVALIILFTARYIKKAKSHLLKKPLSNHSDESSVGLVEVPESEIIKRNTESMDSLRNVINDIEGFNTKGHDLDNGFIQRYWKDQFSYLETQLEIDKVLMIKVLENDEYKVERYNHFSINTLKHLEDQLNKRSSVLNELVQKRKNLYFSGPVNLSGAFSLLFDESEKNKFYQLYILPLVDKEQLKGILFLIKDGKKQISSSDLKPLLIGLEL